MADPGTNTCTFAFKKRSTKNRSSRKRNNTSSEDDGTLIFNL